MIANNIPEHRSNEIPQSHNRADYEPTLRPDARDGDQHVGSHRCWCTTNGARAGHGPIDCSSYWVFEVLYDSIVKHYAEHGQHVQIRVSTL